MDIERFKNNRPERNGVSTVTTLYSFLSSRDGVKTMTPISSGKECELVRFIEKEFGTWTFNPLPGLLKEKESCAWA